MNTTQKVIEIFSKLKVEMNGAVTQAMAQRGVSYGLNYGVSAITIKRAVQSYSPDHTLAQALWRQQIREMKLAAIFIDNPHQVTATQMEQWITECQTVELAQQCAMQLFWKSEHAPITIEQWLFTTQTTEPLKTTAALLMAGRLANSLGLTPTLATKIVDYAPMSEETDLHTLEALRYALREIYATHHSLQPSIKQIPDTELQSQLEYV